MPAPERALAETEVSEAVQDQLNTGEVSGMRRRRAKVVTNSEIPSVAGRSQKSGTVRREVPACARDRAYPRCERNDATCDKSWSMAVAEAFLRQQVKAFEPVKGLSELGRGAKLPVIIFTTSTWQHVCKSERPRAARGPAQNEDGSFART